MERELKQKYDVKILAVFNQEVIDRMDMAILDIQDTILDNTECSNLYAKNQAQRVVCKTMLLINGDEVDRMITMSYENDMIGDYVTVVGLFMPKEEKEEVNETSNDEK